MTRRTSTRRRRRSSVFGAWLAIRDDPTASSGRAMPAGGMQPGIDGRGADQRGPARRDVLDPAAVTVTAISSA